MLTQHCSVGLLVRRWMETMFISKEKQVIFKSVHQVKHTPVLSFSAEHQKTAAESTFLHFCFHFKHRSEHSFPVDSFLLSLNLSPS